MKPEKKHPVYSCCQKRVIYAIIREVPQAPFHFTENAYHLEGIMQAVILAAGMGKRLKELTRDNTKGMVEVNGKSLINRMLDILDQEELSRIIIVVGYKGDRLIQNIESLSIKTPVVFINNPVYDKTNNIYSLALAKEYLTQEDTLLFESDLIFQKSIVDRLIEDPRPALAVVDKFESWMDGTCMKLDSEDRIEDFIPGRYLKFFEKEDYFKTVNIYKFSREFSRNTYVPFLSAYEQAMGENEYYESVLKLIAMLEDTEIRALRLQGETWYEIDNAQDLDIAEYLFTDDPIEKYRKICGRYGGFWRFPKMLDFCYLVNPYFPNQKMTDEISSNFAPLMRQYPSGARVNCLLASGAFGVKEEHIIAGNGASELIKELIENHLTGKIGVIRPTFEEYPNRADQDEIVAYVPESRDFSYTADDLIRYFSDHPVSSLILINPDNPSGNYLKPAEIIKLLDWCGKTATRLILDESFVDFIDIKAGGDIDAYSFFKEDLLETYPALIVVKSISKSYGVPGFRLGVLANADESLIAKMKKGVSIWDINSFGEFFLQILEKYKKAYKSALVKHNGARKVLTDGLSGISWLSVFPSQANYVMCEVTDGRSSLQLCADILSRYNMLVKDLSPKIGNGKQYLRIAVRTADENRKLIEVLKQI